MDIIASEGIDAFTIVRLATTLDISVGGLYRWFDSKEAIIVALQERAIGEFHEAQQARLATANELIRARAPSEEVAALLRVIVAFTAYLEDAVVAPVRHRLMDTFISTPTTLLSDDQARAIDEQLRPILETCGSLLIAASGAGSLEPGESIKRTHVLWAALHGLNHFRKRDRIQPPELQVDSLAQSMVSALLVGWGADPAAVLAALALYARMPLTPSRPGDAPRSSGG